MMEKQKTVTVLDLSTMEDKKMVTFLASTTMECKKNVPILRMFYFDRDTFAPLHSTIRHISSYN